ncbi:aspartate/glutamate racemase family protein [Bradyrhizobium manausense]|uniref:aspartate/glutamate racemase family protein n=1 Tax=Bradyrhizobium TaxID=374 RepID=UPI001BA56407|nr:MULTISPECIES: aspartate/glutamate racemase family protein [Bradyrhizobium]MBR0826934.1 aspartate/glutamate racemase family protein [Bradyrhizobium manausense]UVO32215.1 aspartate/glutamate racemase family protein [Bradyrhizobium arachidis]
MRLHIVNPNTTASMTAKIAAAARAVALPDTVVDARQPEMGPVSIEGFYDEAFAVPGMLGCIRDADRDGADAHIIACFDDTGLDAARAVARAPVIGIGEAAFHMASLIAARFAVVTTLGVSIVPIEHNLQKYGLLARCARVRAAEVPVLALEERNADALAKISGEIAAAISDDRAEAIVLGCAGMADLAGELAARHGLPVVDGVAAAVTLAEGLVRLGLKTSRLGPYATPGAKAYSGLFSRFQP